MAAILLLFLLLTEVIRAQSGVDGFAPAATPAPSPGTCGWSEAPGYPVPIGGHAVTSVGNSLYGFGGDDSDPMTANACHKFDGTAWTTLAPLPIPLGGPAAVNDGTNIYVLGGADLNSGDPVNTLYRYDPVMNSYATLAPFATPTYFHAAIYLGGKIYKFGGTSFFNYTNALEIYDVATNTWTAGANYPLAATRLSAFAHGSFLYAAGGISSPNDRSTAKTYRYDPATNTWDDAAIADLPVARNHAVAAFYNGGGVLAGGEIGDPNGIISASVISWNPGSNTWSALPSMLGARWVANGAVLNGSFYVVGGNGGQK